MLQLNWDDKKVNAAVQLFDLAVKAAGLNAANAALALAQDLQEALKAAQQKQEPAKEPA